MKPSRAKIVLGGGQGAGHPHPPAVGEGPRRRARRTPPRPPLISFGLPLPRACFFLCFCFCCCVASTAFTSSTSFHFSVQADKSNQKSLTQPLSPTRFGGTPCRLQWMYWSLQARSILRCAFARKQKTLELEVQSDPELQMSSSR
ncbi:unnamed protein product [Symbiodinium natans]|uniref:Uncharacterized protein n=1 Tax=Symbiodinium natans TaxID=878477 RepID=A0A812GTR2_9DINO|nr:unnamed protein product [Symbiodinium natans]